MGGPRGSGRVITRVFSLHVGLSRHFTRLRHTLVTIGAAEQGCDLPTVVRPIVNHGQQNAVDLELTVDILLHGLFGAHFLRPFSEQPNAALGCCSFFPDALYNRYVSELLLR